MKKFLFYFLLAISTASLNAQKNVSVVELFCNTGDYDSRLAIPELRTKAMLADADDLNHIYIQHEVAKTYSNWTDQYALTSGTQKYNQYKSLGLIDSLADVAKNGAVSTSTPWYNCDPADIDVYTSGAKKVSLWFESFNNTDSTLAVKFVLARKYTATDAKSIHIYVLESGITVNVSGGDNNGQTFTMNNVARAVRVMPATIYSDTVHLRIPVGTNLSQTTVVAYIQDDNTCAIVGGTRGFVLQPYITTASNKFSVVEMFCNTGCYGAPPAVSSMYSYAATAETNGLNQALIELHVSQTFGNWTDVYTLALNDQRYDNYSWNMGILAGLSAVAKNGIRYTPDVWNSCKPQEKTGISFINLQYNSFSNSNLIIDYTLSGKLGPHDRVYFYVVESGLSVTSTGGEVPGTTYNMNNVARAARVKTCANLSDSVSLIVPANVNLQKARVLAYIQNDVTYEITGGTKGFLLGALTNTKELQQEAHFSVYPNPTSSTINLDLSSLGHVDHLCISIYTINGQLSYSKQLEQIPSVLNINDHHLNPGIYFIKVQGEKTFLVKRLEIF